MNEKEKEQEQELKIKDRRHWVDKEDLPDGETGDIDLECKPTYVGQLEKQMAENDAKLKGYIAAYKKKMEENDQFRDRLSKDVDNRVETRAAEFIRGLLPVVDNLGRALDSARKTKDVETLIEGIGMVQSGILRLLKENGMEEMDCIGKEFNPSTEEAVSVIDVDEKEKDNIVLEVLQPGFLMKGKLLRPASVKVGRMVKKG